jgi:hypothetical protein
MLVKLGRDKFVIAAYPKVHAPVQVVSADKLTEVTEPEDVIESEVTEVRAGNETDVVGVKLDTLNAPVVVSAGKLMEVSPTPLIVKLVVTVAKELKSILVRAASEESANDVPVDIKAGKLIVVREAIPEGANPAPTLVREGPDKVVRLPIVAGIKDPPTDSNRGMFKLVKAVKLFGIKFPPIFTKAGNDKVGNDGIVEDVTASLIYFNFGKLRVVKTDNPTVENVPLTYSSSGASKVAKTGFPETLNPPTYFKSGIDSVVKAACDVGLKDAMVTFRLGKDNDVKAVVFEITTLFSVPSKSVNSKVVSLGDVGIVLSL